jgi:hypothetical protein
MAISYDVHREAEIYNTQPWIIDMVKQRQQYLSDIPNYTTGDVEHHLPTFQITSRDQWKKLDFPLSYIPLWLEHHLVHLDTPGSAYNFGELRVSLLRQRNEQSGQHDAIALVYLIPHFEFCDGIISCMQYTDGSERHQIFSNLFDLAQGGFVAGLTEIQILSYIASQSDIDYLLHKFFKPGFNSIPFDAHYTKMNLKFYFGPECEEEDYEYVEHDEQDEDEVVVKIPPPPKMSGVDFADLYFKELAKYPEENEACSQEVVNSSLSSLEKAREAAKLKREKKQAANVSRKEGKNAADKKRQQIADEALKNAWTKQEQLDEKISKARKAMGVRKNEPNPPGLGSLIEKWKYEIFYADP